MGYSAIIRSVITLIPTHNDMALLVRGYVVRWLMYYCTFRMYCETHVYTSEKNSTTAYIIILLLEMVTIPIQTCIPTADLDYGEDIMFYVPQGT